MERKYGRSGITILTQPILTSAQETVVFTRQRLRTYWYALRGKGVPAAPAFGGHPGVTRSLISGLQRLELSFVLEPRSIDDVTEICVVLSGLPALKQAIAWRRHGIIKRLIVGPNVAVLPSDAPDLLGSPLIDLVLSNSVWTRELYTRDLPTLNGRCAIWPAGVDETFWRPSVGNNRSDVLVYVKNDVPSDLVDLTVEELRRRGAGVRMLRYGTYDHFEFRDALDRSRFAIFFSRLESQGLALAEAWSMDVPTLVWEGGDFEFRSGTARAIVGKTSSAPYLTPECGVAFHTASGLRDLIDQFCSSGGLHRFQPRRRVLAELTDVICARHLWDLANGHLSMPPALRGRVSNDITPRAPSSGDRSE